MKKIFLVLLCCSFSLFFSCHRVEKNTKSIGMANPVKDCTPEYLLEAMGVSFNEPAESQEILYSSISDSIAQMRFNWKGCNCIARIKSSDKMDDISGCYYDWEKEIQTKIGWCDAVIKYAVIQDGNIVAVCNWYDVVPGLLYSFSMVVPGIGPGDVSDVAELVQDLATQTYVITQHEVE